MDVRRFEPGSEGWEDYVAHLRRVDQARWVVDEEGRPLQAGLHFLGVVDRERVVGNLGLKEQVVTMPATEWSGGEDRPLRTLEGEDVRETFVQTFCVEEDRRRRGIGRALQEAAVALTREIGCVQMRSWSSLDKPANYALKLSMGFAMHPSVHDAASGYQVSGVYFVKRVDT